MITNTQIKAFADEKFSSACEFRHEIHRHPELGNQELKTTEKIEEVLDALKIEHFSPLETGVVATVGKGKKRIALRADIDALCIDEKSNEEFCSLSKGKMHACGHDVHLTALLFAMVVLKEHEDELENTVVAFFEPDEEGNGGAQRLIDSKAFDDSFDGVFGFHVLPGESAKTALFKWGKSYAASDMFKLSVFGRSSHGAEPQNGINAITVLSSIITNESSLISRILPPTESAVLSFCEICGGTQINVIPESASTSGIIRTFGKKNRKLVKESFKKESESIAKSLGARAEIEFVESYPGVTNDEKMTAKAKALAEDVLGSENVKIKQDPTLTTEDFGVFLDHAPGTFFHVGTGFDAPLHSAEFRCSDLTIKTAMKVYLKIAFSF